MARGAEVASLRLERACTMRCFPLPEECEPLIYQNNMAVVRKMSSSMCPALMTEIQDLVSWLRTQDSPRCGLRLQ